MTRAAIALALAACGSVAPAHPAAGDHGPPTEACVNAFVARDLGPDARIRVRRIPHDGEPHFLIFAAEWGEPHDCESGCFSSRAEGVAVGCDRLGWFAVSDYEQEHRAHPRFELTAGDTILLDDRLWAEASRRSDRFVAWIAKSPGAPPEVRAKAAAFTRAGP